MPDLICSVCTKSWFREPQRGRVPSVCPPCKDAVVVQPQAPKNERKACETCGKEWPEGTVLGPRTRFCVECAAKRVEERAAKITADRQADAASRPESGPPTATCETCGATWERSTNKGKVPKFCATCKEKAEEKEAADKEADFQHRRTVLCHVCKKSWKRESLRGKVPTTCPDCKAAGQSDDEEEEPVRLHAWKEEDSNEPHTEYFFWPQARKDDRPIRIGQQHLKEYRKYVDAGAGSIFVVEVSDKVSALALIQKTGLTVIGKEMWYSDGKFVPVDMDKD